MKQEILSAIYNTFEEWAQPNSICCMEGCSSCCTQNVTMTALEGERVLQFVKENKPDGWLSKRLNSLGNYSPPSMTFNEFADNCFQGIESTPDTYSNNAPCPFLENDSCSIYPVRPFGCRMFISAKPCSETEKAVVSETYVEGATAMCQLIEHLGQKEAWGSMYDVLLCLLDSRKYHNINNTIAKAVIQKAQMRVKSAKPLPGFLITEKEEKNIQQLINNILLTSIDGKTIEDIFNNK